MLLELKNKVFRHLSNIQGWRTNRKIIVFLVDDWGAIRIRNKEAWLKLKIAGIDVESNRFNKYDTLAGSKDIESLFNTLSKYKDINSNSPVFTAVSAVANPDFERIRKSDFQQYYYEPINKTLERYFPGDDIFKLWQEGINNKLFHPQFHGREHLHVVNWIKALSDNDTNVRKSFELESIGPAPLLGSKYKYMASFDINKEAELKGLVEIVKEGVQIFENLFHYKPTLFTAPSLIHSGLIEPELKKLGFKYIDRAKRTQEPDGNGSYKKRSFVLGRKNIYNQLYITRNCLFEPSGDNESVKRALNDIQIAFQWKKPAIISSHRVNFVGGIDEDNRKLGLKALDELLSNIIKMWPDVEFMTSSDLGSLMEGNHV